MEDRVWLVSYYDDENLEKAMVSPPNAVGDIPVKVEVYSEVPRDDQGNLKDLLLFLLLYYQTRK